MEQSFPAVSPRMPQWAAVNLLARLALACLTFHPAELLASDSRQPLFADAAPLEVEVTLPMEQLRAQKKESEPSYLDGLFAYRDRQGQLVRLNVKARVRGISRLEACDYPPIRLNFVKGELEGTALEGQHKIKLVSRCMRSDTHDQLVIAEYLAYRMYAAIADSAFGVRALSLHVVDSDDKDKPRTGFGFFIEDESALAGRARMPLFEGNGVNHELLDQDALALAELFQFLIGNNDYSFIRGPKGEACCHNARLLGAEQSGGMIPVPYDFDMAGLVSASYALPPAHLPIESVRTRYFTGTCKEQPVWQRALAHIKQRRAALYEEIDELSQLSDKKRKGVVKYIDQFFEIIEDEKKLTRSIFDRCRG